MRVAIIDLGTNTFSLLIVDINDADYKIVHHAKEPVKLGEGGITIGKIAPAAFQRGVNAMRHLYAVILKEKVDTIKAIATSAVREASNKNEFLAEIKKLTGIDINVISGDEEAELIYFGNRMAVDMADETCLIMDIGGGSNEFIIANGSTIFWKQSFKLGVARLLEMFNPENPIGDFTLQSIINYLQTELKPLLIEIKKHPVKRLIGSAGVFESVLHMIGKENIVNGKTCYDISIKDYLSISHKTVHSTAEERMNMKGLISMRRDMIVLSFILIDFILDNTKLESISLSTYSLKEGAITLFMK
jgi:exopolyphosphatase/guanosine-5'-triphosphate,3'-diphosphate pyrophosphatase